MNSSVSVFSRLPLSFFFTSIIGLLAICYSALSSAQSNIRFDPLAQQAQLSQSTVNALWQDKLGFMWIGTQGGLNRYDGYTMKVFRHDPDDANSLSANWINDIYQDQQGLLWIATERGLDRFNKKTEQFTHFYFNSRSFDSKGDNTVSSITQDAEGMFWLGTHGGLKHFNPQTGDVIANFVHDPANPSSLSHNRVTAVVEDKQGQLWVGTYYGGLNRFDRNSKTFTLASLGSQHSISDNITVLFTDNDGRFWVGTADQGLFYWDNRSNAFFNYRSVEGNRYSLNDNWVLSLLHDSQGVLWVGTNKGLNRYQPEYDRFLRIQHNPAVPGSLSGYRVTRLFEDNTAMVWVGMTTGIDLLNRKAERFGHYRYTANESGGLSDNSVLFVIKDNRNEIWLATEGGLSRFDRNNNRYERFKGLEQLSHSRVLSVYQNTIGEHWIGSLTEGLVRFNDENGQLQWYQHEPDNRQSLSHNRVNAVVEDAQQNMWIGTNKGLNRYDRQQKVFQRYYHHSSDINSLSNDQIISLYTDSSGILWVGTRYGGLNRYHADTDSFTRFEHSDYDPDSISHSRVYSMTEDQDQRLWIATRNGLNRFVPEQNKFVHYREKQGLIDNTVYGVLADNQGALWLSSDKGLSRFDLKSQQLRHFDVFDGLQSNEFTSGAAFKAADGELFFGGINGFNAFYPQQIEVDERVPRTVVTDLLLFNQSVPLQRQDSVLSESITYTKSLTLSHDDAVFTFEFAAIDFTNPQSRLYQYRLKGYDKKWLHTDANNRRATYTSLPAGTYQFQVKGANKHGLWGEPTAPITVTILPVPWRTWWAYSLYGVTLVLVAGLVGWLRRQKLRERMRYQLQREQNQEQLQMALWGSGDQLWDIDLQTNRVKRKNRIVQIDYACEDDWYLEELDDGLIHPDDAIEMKNQMTAHFDGETQFYELTYRVKNKKDDWIWLLDRGQVVKRDHRDQPLRFSGMTKNIHQLKATEAELLALTHTLEQRVESRTHQLSQRTEELIQTNEYLQSTQSQLVEAEKMASLGGLVAGISHEINTPVGVAITALSNLKERANQLFVQAEEGKMSRKDFTKYSGQSEESLTIALECLAKASTLVENFKQIAVDQGHERRCEVTLDKLIDDVIGGSLLSNNRGVRADTSAQRVACGTQTNRQGILVDCPRDLVLITYPDAFSKIFSHLIQNTLTHGYLPDQAIDIYIEVTQQDEEISILYQDKGKGMDQQTLEHIFDPFYTTNRSDGTGLGMHVVYNQVSQLLKGHISCDSQPGQGCSFTLSIPMD